MDKGFYLINTTLNNRAFSDYIRTFQTWVESEGSSFAKDMES